MSDETRVRAMPTARATRSATRALLRSLGLTAGIAIALSGCGRRTLHSMVPGDGTIIDYQMADLLAREQTPAGRLARAGLADGHLSAAEADDMWDAYHDERRARDAAEKQRISEKWSGGASGTEARRAETGTGSVNDGPVAESETPARPHHPPEGE